MQLNREGDRDSLTITLLVLHWGLVQPTAPLASTIGAPPSGVAACTIGPGPSGERAIKLLGTPAGPLPDSVFHPLFAPDAGLPAATDRSSASRSRQRRPPVGPHMRKYHVTTSFNNSGATACTSLCRVIYNSAPRVLCFQLSSHDSPAHKVADGLVSPIILGEEKVAPVRRALRALGV